MRNRKLGRTADHRKAMLRNMATSVIQHGQIETTEMKAKEVSAVVDSLVTLAKRGDLHARRQAAAYVRNIEVDDNGTTALQKLFNEIGQPMQIVMEATLVSSKREFVAVMQPQWLLLNL